MAAPVQFDYAAWVARYPEFTAVSSPTAQEYFNEASIYWSNDGSSPASTAAIQSTLLNMITAHIAALYSQSQGDPTPGAAKDANSPVGRMSTATEGSVSIATDNQYPPGSAQWWQQTKYGSSFWTASAQYRTMRYVRGCLQPGGLPGAGPRPYWQP